MINYPDKVGLNVLQQSLVKRDQLNVKCWEIICLSIQISHEMDSEM